ncbi:MAG: L-seryl-tRNA(Sec) selenium transferase [Anaerolineales bacterium]|nr:L-seryl-tRNA(Sec) selenium transferase [Anaerolineales bacterium]
MNNDLYRSLPSVEQLLIDSASSELAAFGRPMLLEAFRVVLDRARTSIQTGRDQPFAHDELLDTAADYITEIITPSLRPVINATGVIIHTNLGRAPLSEAAQKAIGEAAESYNTLEFDLEPGKRGSRSVHAQKYLAKFTGAEDAVVVNNNAAAVLLTLMTLTQGREVIISRGQLVEIGGGFRIPAVMAQSGARLVEVGTTNRTHLRDYEEAITEDTAAIMAAHQSNFKIIGFTTEPELEELADLAHRRGLLLLHDLGSGALLDTAPYGLAHEMTVQESLAAGSDVVCFSGDKLMGGPQAGIIVGRSELVGQIKKHPLARAVRADKLCLAGVAATLLHYLKDEAVEQIPIWQMIAATAEKIRSISRRWARILSRNGMTVQVVAGKSTVGGGSLPGAMLPTWLVSIEHPNLDEFAARLRTAGTPVIGRIEDDRLLLDPRTILPGQEKPLLETIKRIA